MVIPDDVATPHRSRTTTSSNDPFAEFVVPEDEDAVSSPLSPHRSRTTTSSNDPFAEFVVPEDEDAMVIPDDVAAQMEEQEEEHLMAGTAAGAVSNGYMSAQTLWLCVETVFLEQFFPESSVKVNT